MDGFQDTVPLGMPPGEFFEPSLFESYTVKTKTEGTYFCKIQNWRKERPAEYHQLKEEYCVGSNSYTKRRLTMGKKNSLIAKSEILLTSNPTVAQEQVQSLFTIFFLKRSRN